MAAPSVTYTFSNSTAADATEVNQNFDDIINGITDGTKDLTISGFTANGAASFNGNVTLGNATGDDITLTGRIASDLDPKTAASQTIGDATQTWQALYLDNTTTDGGAIYFDGGSTEFLKANAAGTDLQMGGFSYFDLQAGASVKTFGRYLEAKSANYTITDTDGVSVILMTTGSSDRTVTLPTASANTSRIITVKKVDSGTGRLILSEEGTDLIDGYSSIRVPWQYDSVTVLCDGTTWHVIDRTATSRSIAYTPTTAALGTVSGVNIRYQRVGWTSINIFGEITTGTTAGSEAQFGLPSGLTIGGDASSTVRYGKVDRDVSSTGVTVIRGLVSESYFTFHADSVNDSTSINPLTATGQNGNNRFGSSERLSIQILSVPIAEWEDVA